MIAAIAVAIGGGAALYQMLPSVDWSPLISTSPMMTIAGSIAGVVLAGIPLAAIIFVDSPANLQLVSYVIRTEMVTVDYMDTGCRYFCHQPLLPGMALSFPLGRMT